MSKQAGRMSQGANDFLAPLAPTIGTATNIGTNRPYNNGAASVTFTAQGPYAATSYTVTASSGGYTATGSSSPLTVEGLQSDTAYTFTVTATNASGTSPASSASNSITATTVPQAPSAPSASSPNANQDVVSWSAPANGGSAITNYHWDSNDGKSGDTGTATSVTVDQEAGTAQTYTVYATNANGNSATSSASGSVTTTFSFVPFSVFGFSPFSVFGFSPFGVFGFSPFGFSPFGFSPFGFSPFGFSPFGFAPMGNKGSLLGTTLVKTANGLVTAGQLSVGDQLISVVLPNLPESGWTKEDVQAWNISGSSLSYSEDQLVTTTIVSIDTYQAEGLVLINGDIFSQRHAILANREGVAQFVNSTDVLESDLIWSTASLEWLPVTQLEKMDVPHEVISVNCEPYDLFFTENMLVHDTNLDTPTA